MTTRRKPETEAKRREIAERREKVVAFITANPDAPLKVVAKRLNATIGQLNFDLKTLRKQGRLSLRYCHYDEFSVSRRRREIVRLLQNDPKLTARQIAKILGEPFEHVNRDRWLLNKAGKLPANVRTARRTGSAMDATLEKAVQTSDSTSLQIARALKKPFSSVRIAKVIDNLKKDVGLDPILESEKQWRRAQVENHWRRGTIIAELCGNHLGVFLPADEHKRWIKLHRLKEKGFTWSENGIHRTSGLGVEKDRTTLRGVSTIRDRMRAKGIKTENQERWARNDGA